MSRKRFDTIASTVGVLLAALLLAVSGLALWAHSFIDDNVRTQLIAQKVFFPPAGSESLNDPAVKPFLAQYAGQQLQTGEQARAYADHFIAVHLSKASGGLTYSELSTQARANPSDTTLPPKVDTAFRGETLRGLLLNAYAFGKMAEVARYVGFIALGGAGLLLLLSGLGAVHARRTPADLPVHVPGWHPENVSVTPDVRS